MAEREFGLVRLLDPEDVNVETPGKISTDTCQNNNNLVHIHKNIFTQILATQIYRCKQFMAYALCNKTLVLCFD